MSARVSDANLRLQSRKHDRRRRRIIGGVVAAAAIVLFGAGVYLVGFSPVLSTQKVQVTGLKVLAKNDVVATAGIVMGTPLARVDITAAADRLAAIPAVADVTVARSWPDTVTIAIIERRARLAIATDGGFRLADASGVVFQTVSERPSGLVLVEAPADDQQLLVDVGTVYSALSPDTAARVQRMVAPSRDGIELRLSNGARVVWGSAEQSALKSQVLDDLLTKSGTVFDVSAPGFPTYR
ncbi:MAG: FtsQ-type POTRA domain-containing protein [Propionibacteriales bacterium]|nr:FtsQ-type POTRA domain-containing protein [Propionibacteriales bacterium]